MRDPAGYEAPYVVGAHLTRPTIPFPLYGCLSRSPSPFRSGTIFRKGAKPRCRSGLPALICSSNIMANFRVGSASGTPAKPLRSPPPLPLGATRATHGFPSPWRPPIWTIVFARGQAIVNLFSLTSFVAAGLYFITRKIRSRGWTLMNTRLYHFMFQ